MELKSFVSDLSKIAKIGISETWLMPDDDLFFENVPSSTHALFRYARDQNHEKKW